MSSFVRNPGTVRIFMGTPAPAGLVERKVHKATRVCPYGCGDTVEEKAVAFKHSWVCRECHQEVHYVDF